VERGRQEHPVAALVTVPAPVAPHVFRSHSGAR
jgi:hypothetical protein